MLNFQVVGCAPQYNPGSALNISLKKPGSLYTHTPWCKFSCTKTTAVAPAPKVWKLSTDDDDEVSRSEFDLKD